MQGDWTIIEGGVTAPGGFRACGVTAGIKKPRPDMALLVSDRPAALAGVFTTNKIQAAPVRLCRERVAAGRGRAVVVNAGVANACTGPGGMEDARQMQQWAAAALGMAADDVCVCSTGTIGLRLPMAKIEAGIRAAAGTLADDGGAAAARAIMTTDTRPKECALELTVEGRAVRIGGMCKGAGMIEPNMATMLAFLTTDAAVEPAALQALVREAAAVSFNAISVDGDQSTNDTFLCLANGAAGTTPLAPGHADWARFAAAFTEVARRLACMIVQDGEGATCFVTVTVRGAASDADARLAARAVANSLLVKTSWFGGDPNWGRVVAAVGYSGAAVDETRVDVAYDDCVAVRGGCKAADTALADLEAVLRRKTFTVTVDLHLGEHAATVYSCDCSEDYVKINAEYMT